MPHTVDILLVEDNPVEVELAQRAFRKNATLHPVQVVENGADALDFLFCRGKFADRDTNDMPKIILLDISLPKINGLEVLKQVKSHPHTQAIPVVVLTNSLDPYDTRLASKYGADGYVQKPLDFSEFAQVLDKTIARWL